jgi:GNAT superfamily N-acetyltransferase
MTGMEKEEILAVLDLGYVELYREMLRRGGPGICVDKDGMMLVAGVNLTVRAAMRTDPTLPAREFLGRIETFFLERKMDHHIVTRAPQDSDIDDLLRDAGFEPDYVESVMCLQRKPEAAQVPAHGSVKEVRDARGAKDFATAVCAAFGEPGIADAVITGPRSVIAPHIRAFVGYLNGEPVATALAMLHAGAAGVFWVGTVDEARHHGFGSALVRTAACAAFDMGARFVWLGSTRMGMPVYHEVGFTELGVDYLEYRFPESHHG